MALLLPFGCSAICTEELGDVCGGVCLGCKALRTVREESRGLKVAELPQPCRSKGVLAAEALCGEAEGES